jgi:hypothetical protein
MEVLTMDLAASAARGRARLREAALCPAPLLPGLRARHWQPTPSGFQGRYLFGQRAHLEEFADTPAGDPGLTLLQAVALGRPAVRHVEQVLALEALDPPVFIISAPRAGSTLLFDLLARSESFWTVGGESEGVIEGIPALHPASRGFDSHRLDDRAADATTVETLRAGFLAELRDRHGRRFLELPEIERPARVLLLEKTPENALRVPFLAAAFPGARFLFLHRDPRQNVSSILEAWRRDGFVNIPALPGWPHGAWHFLLPEGWRDLRDASLLDVASFQWNAANEQALDDLEVLPRDRWIDIDYAELVLSPQAVVRRVCDFVGVPMDGSLQAALARPLPVAATAISPPSPIKWRSNREFHESALERYRLTSGRLRSLGRHSAPPSDARQPDSPVRYSCFLDALEPTQDIGPDDWLVNPSLQVQIGPTVPPSLLRQTRFRDRFLADFPLLWVEDPATGVHYPHWSRRELVGVLRRLVAGHPPPPLPAALFAHLVAAGVLVTASEREDRRRDFDALAARARQGLAEHLYCELPQLLHRAHAAALCRYYEALIGSGTWALGDEQVPLRHGWHNEMVARYFHHQLTDVVSRVAGEPVRPSYVYVSGYRPGAVLKPHVDRKQCTFTLSVMVEPPPEPSRAPWPLWFQTHQGNVSVTQSSGDGVLFRGSDLPHWRDRPPPGHAPTTLIFHYVPRDFVGVID